MLTIHATARRRAIVMLLGALGIIAGLGIRPMTRFVQDVRQDPSVFATANPPLVDLLQAELPANGEARVGGLDVKLSFDPPDPIAGERTTVTWFAVDRNGRTARFDRTMHGKPMHAYGVRDDLGGDIIHMHPAQQDEGPSWKDMIIFPSAGRWHLQMQAPHAGTLYVLSTTVDVAGAPAGAVVPDDARVRAMFQHEVALDAPQRVAAGTPARFRFAVRHVSPTSRRAAVLGAREHHNLIIAHAGDGRLWNHHGDGSVDMLGDKSPLKVRREFSIDDPFVYEITFPSPGTWMVDFEYLGEAAPFMVHVE